MTDRKTEKLHRTRAKVDRRIGRKLVVNVEEEATINYRTSSLELRQAWFTYKATPGVLPISLVDFTAGYNAAKALVK